MFGFSFEKLLVLGVVAGLILGPERLPGYARRLAKFVRAARGWADTAKGRIREELGEDDLDWKKLDPRQYDPRRIIREALTDTAAPVVHPVREVPIVTPQSEEIRPAAADEQQTPR